MTCSNFPPFEGLTLPHCHMLTVRKKPDFYYLGNVGKSIAYKGRARFNKSNMVGTYGGHNKAGGFDWWMVLVVVAIGIPLFFISCIVLITRKIKNVAQAITVSGSQKTLEGSNDNAMDKEIDSKDIAVESETVTWEGDQEKSSTIC